MSRSVSSKQDRERFDWIAIRDAPKRASRDIIARFELLSDLSSTVSDVLDELGLIGAVGSSRLRASINDRRIVGSAVTVRNVEQTASPYANVSRREWKMAEVLAIAEAGDGDVLLIEGLAEVSNMGGLMSTIAKRQGIIGAVVEGGVRDLGHSRSIEFPIWSRDVSPVTGKWRCITQEINGAVSIGGVTVQAGDLVIADETGICFVPCNEAERVVTRCEEIASYEALIEQDIAEGVSVEDLIEKLYSGRPGKGAASRKILVSQ